nr:ORF3 [Torque teno virus]
MSWRPPLHSIQGREDQWYAGIFHTHFAFCGCGDPVGRINRIAHRFPNAGPPRPPPGLDQPNLGGPEGPGGAPRALPALPAPAEPEPAPRRGGGADGDSAAGAAAAADHGGYDEGDLEDLFAAAAEDDMQSTTPARSPPMSYPIPIDTLACYKSLTRQSSDRRQCSTNGTGDVGNLAKEVLKESKKTQRMMNMLQGLYQEKETSSTQRCQAPQPPKKKATLYSKPSKSRARRAAPRTKNKHPKKKRTRKKRSWSSSSSRNSTSESSSEASNSSWETSSDSAAESTGTPSYPNSGSLYPRPAFP